MNAPEEKQLPEMSNLELEDIVSVLLSIPPEGEEVTIYEDSEDE